MERLDDPAWQTVLFTTLVFTQLAMAQEARFEEESLFRICPFKNRSMVLARISHQFSTAAADPGMSTALRSVGLLDILSRLPAGPSDTYIFTLGAKRQAPYPSAPPRCENW